MQDRILSPPKKWMILNLFGGDHGLLSALRTTWKGFNVTEKLGKCQAITSPPHSFWKTSSIGV